MLCLWSRFLAKTFAMNILRDPVAGACHGRTADIFTVKTQGQAAYAI